MEVINEKIEMYKGLENQIERRYDITLTEILELAKIGQQSKEESFNALGYAYALGFKRGRSCEKNKRKRAKETSEKDTDIKAVNNMLKDVDIEKLKVVCWYVQKIWMKA